MTDVITLTTCFAAVYQRFGFLTFCLLLIICIAHILDTYEYGTHSDWPLFYLL